MGWEITPGKLEEAGSLAGGWRLDDGVKVVSRTLTIHGRVDFDFLTTWACCNLARLRTIWFVLDKIGPLVALGKTGNLPSSRHFGG